MADLTVMPAWTCSTNVSWSTVVTGSTGTPYTVQWGRLWGRDLDLQGCQYGYTCECRGFEVRRHCKHTKAVGASGERCGWNAELEPTLECAHDSMDEPCCPDCGASVEALRVGV